MYENESSLMLLDNSNGENHLLNLFPFAVSFHNIFLIKRTEQKCTNIIGDVQLVSSYRNTVRGILGFSDTN